MQSLAARDSRVKILRNKVNVGPYVAKNQALQIARGEFITGHDADDWAHPQNTRVHVQTMLSDRLIKASHCYHLRAEAQGTFTRFMKRGTRSHDGAMRLSSVSAMFHTETLRNVLGGWDSVRFGADSELICRAQKTLGDCYKSFVFVGLICLDHEGGLTNHPKYGIDKVNGMSLVRKIYKEKWSAWHESLMPADPYMPFPAKVRRFEAPQEMLVPIEAIEENIAPMRKHL